MKKIITLIILALSLITLLINSFFVQNPFYSNILSFFVTILFILGLYLIIPFGLIPYIFFDNREQTRNETLPALIKKMRFRAILFNNTSIAIFIFTLLVIGLGFYLLVDPPIQIENQNGQKIISNYIASDLTVRIGASVLLIFLVQILFNVFKYLLRVAAFYNAKADALEINSIKPEIELGKLMELLTPDKYEISDLKHDSFSNQLVDMLKAKLVK